MNIQYKNNKVKKQCTNLKSAKKDFAEYAEKVLATINIIEQMTSFKDLLLYPPAHCHKLEGKNEIYWAIDVNGRKCSLRIILAPLDEAANIVISDSNFATNCISLNIILIKEVSNHYE